MVRVLDKQFGTTSKPARYLDYLGYIEELLWTFCVNLWLRHSPDKLIKLGI